MKYFLIIGFLVVQCFSFIHAHPEEADDDPGAEGANGTNRRPGPGKQGRLLLTGLLFNKVAKVAHTLGGADQNELKKNIQYFLYTPKRGRHDELKIKSESGVETKGFSSRFEKDAPVKVLVHGWPMFDSTGAMDRMLKVKNEYLLKEETMNVIVVDWTVFDDVLMFRVFRPEVQNVGEKIAEFLIQLRDAKYIKDFRNVHCIGFDLGAHMCGETGVLLQKEGHMGRITGIDPAGKSYGIFKEKKDRLDEGDALFVDVMHCAVGKQGSELKAGHADFFVNSGEDQPDCPEKPYDIRGDCDHLRCLELFRASVFRENYPACKCKNWELFKEDKCGTECGPNGADTVLMGDKCPETARGTYYVKANKPKFKKLNELDSEELDDEYIIKAEAQKNKAQQYKEKLNKFGNILLGKENIKSIANEVPDSSREKGEKPED